MRWSESLCASAVHPISWSHKGLLCIHAMRSGKRLLVGKSDKIFVTVIYHWTGDTLQYSLFRLYLAYKYVHILMDYSCVINFVYGINVFL